VSHSHVPGKVSVPRDWRTGGTWDWRLNVNSNGVRWWNRSRQRGAAFIPWNTKGFTPTLSGVTRDSTGAALPGCTVDMFVTGTDTFIATTVSDGSGNFTLLPPASGPYYLVAYLAGSPDVAGTTVNTLVAS